MRKAYCALATVFLVVFFANIGATNSMKEAASTTITTAIPTAAAANLNWTVIHPASSNITMYTMATASTTTAIARNEAMGATTSSSMTYATGETRAPEVATLVICPFEARCASSLHYATTARRDCTATQPLRL